ncbi:MAG: L-2-hydroxyglutarate oxidase [Actinomycetota bacterium]|nr:L-2-hydroxyglutarate oxidase [Actinomycetota bacterium]
MVESSKFLQTSPPVEADVVIVGAGIVGLATARELSLRHDGLRVAVLEREAEPGAHQTGRSSGVIHAGIYYVPGSLKARLCIEGARELYEFCGRRGIPAKRGGKLIVATRPEEISRLDELEHRGRKNEVPGLRRLGPGEIAEVEPHARGIAALHSPATGTVDFRAVTHAYAEDVVAEGGSVITSCEVRAIRESEGGVTVGHTLGTTRANALVSCAGAWSDRLAVAAGAPADPRIVPFRGGYLRLRPERAHLVRSNIYPVPDPDLPFLGAHLTRGHSGEVLLGPTALMVGALDAYKVGRVRPAELWHTVSWPGTWRMARNHWRSAATELRHALRPSALVREAQRFVPELNTSDFVPGSSGIRAQALARDGSLVDDFVLSRTGRCVHVRNAPSPAATSSLAIARLIADEVALETSG